MPVPRFCFTGSPSQPSSTKYRFTFSLACLLNLYGYSTFCWIRFLANEVRLILKRQPPPHEAFTPHLRSKSSHRKLQRGNARSCPGDALATPFQVAAVLDIANVSCRSRRERLGGKNQKPSHGRPGEAFYHIATKSVQYKLCIDAPGMGDRQTEPQHTPVTSQLSLPLSLSLSDVFLLCGHHSVLKLNR